MIDSWVLKIKLSYYNPLFRTCLCQNTSSCINKLLSQNFSKNSLIIVVFNPSYLVGFSNPFKKVCYMLQIRAALVILYDMYEFES